jgi:hypothetical protein
MGMRLDERCRAFSESRGLVDGKGIPRIMRHTGRKS